jgi:hypothetical protein
VIEVGVVVSRQTNERLVGLRVTCGCGCAQSIRVMMTPGEAEALRGGLANAMADVLVTKSRIAMPVGTYP